MAPSEKCNEALEYARKYWPLKIVDESDHEFLIACGYPEPCVRRMTFISMRDIGEYVTYDRKGFDVHKLTNPVVGDYFFPDAHGMKI